MFQQYNDYCPFLRDLRRDPTIVLNHPSSAITSQLNISITSMQQKAEQMADATPDFCGKIEFSTIESQADATRIIMRAIKSGNFRTSFDAAVCSGDAHSFTVFVTDPTVTGTGFAATVANGRVEATEVYQSHTFGIVFSPTEPPHAARGFAATQVIVCKN